jgi:hypothetical protein
MATATNIDKMKKAYPPWGHDEDPDHFGFSQAADYGAMIELMPGEAVVHVDVDDYQGDTYVLLRDGARFGYLSFGWGSCSGCDALQACNSFAEVADLYEEMLDWFHAHDWEGDWSWHEETHREFLRKALEALDAANLKGEAWLDAELARLSQD